MNIVIIQRDSAEWNDMWDRLKNHPVNNGLEEPTVALNQGEAWQYMGSYQKSDKVIHEFRHRLHPLTDKRENVVFHASDKLTTDQIEKTIKVK